MTHPVIIVHTRPGRTEIQSVDIPPAQMDREEFRAHLSKLVYQGVLEYDPVEQIVWLPPAAAR